jgi:hypothetical protein
LRKRAISGWKLVRKSHVDKDRIEKDPPLYNERRFSDPRTHAS